MGVNPFTPATHQGTLFWVYLLVIEALYYIWNVSDKEILIETQARMLHQTSLDSSIYSEVILIETSQLLQKLGTVQKTVSQPEALHV